MFSRWNRAHSHINFRPTHFSHPKQIAFSQTGTAYNTLIQAASNVYRIVTPDLQYSSSCWFPSRSLTLSYHARLYPFSSKYVSGDWVSMPELLCWTRENVSFEGIRYCFKRQSQALKALVLVCSPLRWQMPTPRLVASAARTLSHEKHQCKKYTLNAMQTLLPSDASVIVPVSSLQRKT